MSMFKQNVAVFVGRSKRYSRVNILVENDTIQIKDLSSGAVLEEFPVVEPASTSGTRVWAWDIPDIQHGNPDKRLRLVAVLGCGCGGVPPYKVDAEYSGAI